MKTISRDDPKYALDSGHVAVAKVGAGESFIVETHTAALERSHDRTRSATCSTLAA